MTDKGTQDDFRNIKMCEKKTSCSIAMQFKRFIQASRSIYKYKAKLFLLLSDYSNKHIFKGFSIRIHWKNGPYPLANSN